jgi:hypothetical protein
METVPSRDRLRRLAALRPERGRVLSVFFDLDPSTFGTAVARASQLTSVLDEAHRRIGEESLDSDERAELHADLDRLRDAFEAQSMAAGGSRGIAAYACGPADLLEIFRLPTPVRSHVAIGVAPHVEPLALANGAVRWCIVIPGGGETRILLGDEHELTEAATIRDSDPELDRNDTDEGLRHHLRRVGDELFALLKRQAYERLAIAGAQATQSTLEDVLHEYVRERVSGRLHIEPHATPAAVLKVARPLFDQVRAEHEEELLERLRAGLGRDDGSAVVGAQPVLGALTERRVEALLVHPAALQDDELLEPAVELALEQAAEIVPVADADEVDGVAALLRF